jgi:hypothetical protein
MHLISWNPSRGSETVIFNYILNVSSDPVTICGENFRGILRSSFKFGRSPYTAYLVPNLPTPRKHTLASGN